MTGILRRFRPRSLRTRLAVLYGGLFAVAMILVSIVLWTAVETRARETVRSELVASGTVFDRVWTARAARLRDAADLLARDFGFRAAVATGDTSTTESALANLKTRLKVSTAFIVGVDGTIVGIGDPKHREEAVRLWQALDTGAMTGVISLGGSARQMAAAPVLAPTLSGWVVFAADLDVREMRSIERLSAIPLAASVFQSAPDGRWIDASRGERIDPGMSAFIATSLKAGDVGEIETAGGGALALAKRLPALPGSPPAVLLLRYPLAQALAPYRQLQWAIALTSLAGLALILLATLRIAQSLTRPIARLDAAVGKLASGGQVAVEVDGRDELARLAASFNAMAADIVERERRITHLAFNDTLTGLPNRTLFGQHLEHELKLIERAGGRLALLCIDLDNFKHVNDTLGHPVGDGLLRQMATRLAHAFPDCFVARLGGDEFVVVQAIASDDTALESIHGIADRALVTIAEPMVVDGHDIAPGASIGIALAPFDGHDTGTLMKNADLALYRAKEAGRRTYAFYEESMNERAQMRRQIEGDLRHAIAEGQFELHFQPLFDLAKNRIGAFEALIRWNHPTRGMVLPLDFIGIAEESGLIVPIGEWVLREACINASRWPEHVRVAVNVSPTQFARPGLANVVLQTLAQTGLAPQRLELEITESVFLEGSEATLKVLHSLRAIGVRIALDDFGTGYSSLSYLQSFPFDKIKIDRSFIQDLLTRPGAGAIVKAITGLADALGMETTAEGVEESEQLAALRGHGCTSVQGYLFSRPVDAGSVAGLLGADYTQREVRVA